MSEIDIEITSDEIDAVTDPDVCEVADIIVLRNQGCGNASVLIDRLVKRVRLQARTQALEEAAKVAERPFQPFSMGGCLIMDGAQTEVIATAIRSLITQDNTPSPANTKGYE